MPKSPDVNPQPPPTLYERLGHPTPGGLYILQSIRDEKGKAGARITHANADQIREMLLLPDEVWQGSESKPGEPTPEQKAEVERISAKGENVSFFQLSKVRHEARLFADYKKGVWDRLSDPNKEFSRNIPLSHPKLV